MKIQLLKRMAGPEGNYPSGSVIDVKDNEAKGLVVGGYAISLEPEVKEVQAKPKPKKKAVK